MITFVQRGIFWPTKQYPHRISKYENHFISNKLEWIDIDAGLKIDEIEKLEETNYLSQCILIN